MPRGDSSAERIRDCALELFARHGVAGTSLRMIAAELGVTKAAVYYHYRAKEDIVHAALAPAFDGFEDLLAAADAVPDAQRPGILIDGLARQAVANRRLYAVVLGDVTAGELRRTSPAHLATFVRLRDALAGDRPPPEALVRATMFLAGLLGPAVDPDASRLDDAELERTIASAGRALLGADARADAVQRSEHGKP